MKPDLAGVYITDDHIDVLLGRDAAPSARKLNIASLTLLFNLKSVADDPDDDDVNRFFFKDRSVERTIDETCRWIASKTDHLRSVGIASYGPFVTIARNDRWSFMDTIGSQPDAYGRLQRTSHGRLSEKPIAKLFQRAISKHFGGSRPLITVDTDVSAAAIGEAYNRSKKADGSRDPSVDNEVFVFAKISLGVGAAFMRAQTTWHGRLHTEGGQIHVPLWPSTNPEEAAKEEIFMRHLQGMRGHPAVPVRNPGSVESLASVPAIEARFAPHSFAELKEDPMHIAWEREAWYIAQMLWSITCIVSPHRVVTGGRVMGVPGLLGKVRMQFASIAGSPSFPDYEELREIKTYISEASESEVGFIGRPGIIGALCIAAMEPQRYTK